MSQRVIKFKAWNGRYIENYPELKDWNTEMDFDKETILMQFTGLTEKNGNEVYEGDILHDLRFTDQTFKVVWDDEGAKFTLITITPKLASGINEECDVDTLQEMGLIGNIYNNPELLKV